MKKVLLFAAAVALLVSACQPKQKSFVLNASNLPADLNNVYAYIIENDTKVDSVLVADGAFTYTADSLITDKVSMLTIGEQVYVPFIKEAGTYNLVITPAEDGQNQYSVAPAEPNAESLNSKLVSLNNSLKEAVKPISKAYEEKSAILHDNPNLPADSVALIEKELADIESQYYKANNDVAQKVYDENKDNLIGRIAFSNLEFENDADFVAAFDGASDIVKNDEKLSKKYNTLKTAMATQPGAKYVDFDMEDGLGATAKLSDYLKDGKYLLVDFWASWCGPCRRAMPHLATLSTKYASKLTVLSVGTWDKSIEENNKAKEELKMTWATFYDSKNAGATAYGVSGIPTILLISPEGDILVRTHNPADVDAKIAELKW